MAGRETVLVTGGAGYIGSHCCKALGAAGYQPVVFDNLTTGHADFVKWGPLMQGDVADGAALAAVFAQYTPIAVMHFAAASLVGESVADPQKYYLNNVAGTLSLLQAMRAAGCMKLVFSSTGAVYGNAGSEPIAEDATKRPVNPYGASKLMIEQILSDYGGAYKLNSMVLRYFNASGADPSGAIGEKRVVETHVIPRALMALQGHCADFAVFGDDYETPDGTAVRDYIHVSDLAAAHLRALELLNAGSAGGVYNLGTGQGHSVKSILTAIEQQTGHRMNVSIRPRRAGDPPVLVADPAAARTALGFRPIHSDLSDIIRTAWAWHQVAHPRRHPDRSGT
jgi:UDP-glucose-4-epimerase GalE